MMYTIPIRTSIDADVTQIDLLLALILRTRFGAHPFRLDMIREALE